MKSDNREIYYRFFFVHSFDIIKLLHNYRKEKYVQWYYITKRKINGKKFEIIKGVKYLVYYVSRQFEPVVCEQGRLIPPY